MREVRKGGRQQDGKEKEKGGNDKGKGSWWEDIIKVEIEREGERDKKEEGEEVGKKEKDKKKGNRKEKGKRK